VQHYTNRQDNSFVSNGTLKIVAKKETFTDQGVTKQYTSARLNSKFAFTYGRVEVRAKLPTGAGTWPAIWMLGKNVIEPGSYWTSTSGTVNWPACGEVDIMEHWGNNQNYVQSAMHTPSSYGSTINLGGQTISTVSSDFHIYTLEWTSNKMVFSVDGVIHYTYNPTIKDASTWPFNEPQYLLLNVAMQPYIDPNFTQSAMEVDYVRVYQ
jgi:beta-glucanase (GH16 family)